MTQTTSYQEVPVSRTPIPIAVDQIRAGCASCSLKELCLPVGLSEDDMRRLDKVISMKRRIAKGTLLYRAGDPFQNLYAIKFGHFKTYQVSREGNQQITGFQMGGELLGMDAISTEKHQCDAVALEDSEVCEIPYACLGTLFAEMPGLLRHFHRLMSHEIGREQTTMLLLGSMTAEQRFAAFLVNLSSRYASRGYSSTQFQLRMGREDIGNYLGITIESVSRLISRFKTAGALRVKGREIEIPDLQRLRDAATGTNQLS